MQDLDESDPNIQIIETIIVGDPPANEVEQGADSPYFMDLDTQVVRSLTYGFDNESSGDDDDDDDGEMFGQSDGDVDETDEEASKLAM